MARGSKYAPVTKYEYIELELEMKHARRGGEGEGRTLDAAPHEEVLELQRELSGHVHEHQRRQRPEAPARQLRLLHLQSDQQRRHRLHTPYRTEMNITYTPQYIYTKLHCVRTSATRQLSQEANEREASKEEK